MPFARSRADILWGGWGRMERQPAKEITNAVRACVDACRDADNPLAETAETIGRLRQAGWDEADIRRVQAVVHKLLAAVLAAEPGEHIEVDVRIPEPELSDDTRPAGAGD